MRLVLVSSVEREGTCSIEPLHKFSSYQQAPNQINCELYVEEMHGNIIKILTKNVPHLNKTSETSNIHIFSSKLWTTSQENTRITILGHGIK